MRSKVPTNRCASEKGWALVSVLWVVAILAMLAASVQMLTVTTARTEARLVERAKLDAALDAAIARAIVGITDPRVGARWRVDGTSQRISFNGYDISISVQDESGKIDLNAADVSLLGQLLQAAGEDRENAALIANRISDWRSAAQLESLKGTSDEDYKIARKNYLPRHAPFQTIYELQLVLGVTPELFTRLKPAITVYTARPMFDVAFSPKMVLRALHLNNDTLFEENMDARKEAAVTTGFAKLDPSLPVAGKSFQIIARIEGETKLTREEVVMLTGDDRRPFIVRWFK